MRIFLSYSYEPQDRDLFVPIRELLENFGIVPVSAKNALGGGQLDDEVARKIDACDGLVALCTRRELVIKAARRGAKGPRRWRTSSWITSELQHARTKKIPSLALVEDGVELDGMLSGLARGELVRENLTQSLLALSGALAQWRRTPGFALRLALYPETVTQAIASEAQPSLEYCLVDEGGLSSEWTSARLLNSVGGFYAVLPRVPSDRMVRVRARAGNQVWTSRASAPEYFVRLDAGGGTP